MPTPSTSVLEQSLLELPAWRALRQHSKEISKTSLREFFENDPERGTRFTAEAVGIFLDYSKNRITDETLKLLVQLAEERGLKKHRRDVPRRQDQHHGEPRRPPRRPARAQRRVDHGRRRRRRPRRARCARQDVRLLRHASAAASGRDTPASASATSSTSASAAPTSARSWPTRR